MTVNQLQLSPVGDNLKVEDILWGLGIGQLENKYKKQRFVLLEFS
jgi:hypothetical protein